MSFWTGTHWVSNQPAAKPPPRRGRTRHAVEAVAEGTLIALLVVGLVAGTAFAGKGTARTTASLSGPVLVQDANGNGASNHGDGITFSVSSSAAQPYVGVRCYQGADFVYDSYVGYFSGAWFATHFTLDSGYWVAARSADCTARLFSYDSRGRERVQATRTFTVAP